MSAADIATVSSTKQPVRVLVVDDELSVRNLVTTVLGRQGYEAIPAACGEEAIRALEERSGEVELAFLDLTMPGLSGRDTLRRLRELNPELRVIIASGYPVDKQAFAKETGCKVQDVISKPFRTAELVVRVGQIIPPRP